MVNISYSKLLKLSFVVLLAMVFTIGFTKNTSYAITYEEFYTIMENNVGNSNQTIYNWWNGLKGQDTTISLMQSSWQSNNSIAVYGYYTSTYGWMGMVYFIYNNGNVYRHNDGIQWTVGRDGYKGYSFTKSSFNLSANGGSRSNFVPSASDIINFGSIFNDSNTSWVFITDSTIYSDNTITDETTDTWYFKTYSTTSTNFEKYESNLDYSDNYTLLGKLTGEDIYVWRTRAILYQNNGIIASVNELGQGQNNMIAQKSNNIDDDDIYIYVRTSLLYPNKIYSLDVYYDEDESILEFNETYNFVLGSGDSGYTSQNSTNDIIQNQNENTQTIIEEITKSGDISGDIANFFNGLTTEGLLEDIGYTDFSGDGYVGDYSGRLTLIFNEIKDILTSTGNVTYTIPYMQTTLILNSDDFITPENGLKVFVRTFLIFGTIALFFKYVTHILHKAQEGNTNALSRSIAADDESILM